MNGSSARHEFRAFARNFGIVETRLRGRAQLLGIRESAETYLVSATADGHNVKIREGNLDVKTLIGRQQGLEQWWPAFKTPLPLAAAQVREWIPAPLAAGDMPLDLEHYDTDALIERVVRPSPVLVPAALFKRRWNFALGDSLCELAEISINGAWLMSACVESVDAAQVLELIRDLGLDAYHNESYVAAIRRVTGLAPMTHLPT